MNDSLSMFGFMIVFSRLLVPTGDTARRIFGTELPYIIERNLLNKYFVLITANYIKFFRGVMNVFMKTMGELPIHSLFQRTPDLKNT